MDCDIGEIISSALQKPSVQLRCILEPNLSYDQKEKVEKEISRMLAYCILFKTSDGIEEYMQITNEQKQKEFIKEKIASLLGIPKENIPNSNAAIVHYIRNNLMVNGYVFHAANSVSVEKKMKEGLKGSPKGSSHKDELLHIASIYKKYGAHPPFMYAMNDSKYGKNGWFYDGTPENIAYYADSPEWFNQFTGGSMEYYGTVEQSKRFGYSLRDHEMARDAVMTLIKQYDMLDADEKEIIDFFEKTWELYGKSRPGLILVPTKEVMPMDYLAYPRKEDDEPYTLDFFIEKVIKCECCFQSNQCCDQDIAPEALSCVDLSPIIPKPNLDKQPSERRLTLEECIQMLRGFNLDDLKQAQAFLNSLGKEKSKNDI